MHVQSNKHPPPCISLSCVFLLVHLIKGCVVSSFHASSAVSYLKFKIADKTIKPITAEQFALHFSI